MKCPKCGRELIQSEKNPEYWLCFTCKQKYKKKRQTYSNIPEKEVRAAGEAKVKRRYSQMLEAEEQSKKKKRSKKSSKNDIDNYDDGGSIVPLVVLGVLIIIVAALIAYMYFK
ncbi:hypothetical protein M2145_000520 [Lachnospiraceae bacterium PF1-21]|uniref:Uncharacterized protein n=1 Tax=Ohessyouella blattaphilus TaxID=2949333 RepID=A0ABT1EHA4_9FIRM|nr:hypothetical protein [Ohessyouella blattaphilus]MCP1108677.1 hypothetical protein [Ohessyouella blattaphilus]MCR8562071.1 hypothetical protein [Ohessyouella blattaphilus]